MSESPHEGRPTPVQPETLNPEDQKRVFAAMYRMNFITPQMFVGMSSGVLKELITDDKTETLNRLYRYMFTPLTDEQARTYAEDGTRAHQVRGIKKEGEGHLVVSPDGAADLWEQNKKMLFGVLAGTFLRHEDCKELGISPMSDGVNIRAYLRKRMYTVADLSRQPSVLVENARFTHAVAKVLFNRLANAPEVMRAIHVFVAVLQQAIEEQRDELLEYQAKLTVAHKQPPSEARKKEVGEIEKEAESKVLTRAWKLMNEYDLTDEEQSAAEEMLYLINSHVV